MRHLASPPSSLRLLAVLLLALSSATAIDSPCPNDCVCTPLATGTAADHQLHAKCTSLAGLAQSAKNNAIHSVDCSDIQVEKITTQFDKLSALKHLDLSQNQLAEVPRLNRRLHTLNLANNRITSGKLRRIPLGVQHLNLSHNHLTYLPTTLVALDQLKSIELAGNAIDCNCETLEVRNWIQLKHIRTDNFVVCASPAAVKGMSWLQVRQSELCENGDDIWNDEDENNIMLSDQAVVADESNEKINDDDEFDKDYLPIEKNVRKRQLENETAVHEVELDKGSGDFEEDGSGDSATELLLRMHEAVETSTAEAEEDGSGSGAVVLLVAPTTEDDTLVSTTTEPVDEEILVQVPTLGIFQNVHVHTFDETTASAASTEEPSVIDVVLVDGEGARSRAKEESAPVKNDSLATEENQESAQGTYVLLIILGLLLVGLIAFVVIRRKTQRQKNRRDADAEHGKELTAMNRDQLGKPINGKNGNNNGAANEILPLIGHRDKWDSRIQPHHGLTKPDQEELRRAQEPLLKKIDEPKEYAAVEKPEPTPRTHRPSSVASSNPPAEESNNNYTKPTEPAAAVDQPDIVVDAPVVAPISPRPARYSPVYSPETGRVKIKLTETQKPRTPMLVSRTRSNAGEIITTPVRRPE